MGESLNVVKPSGVAIRVAGSVVARPPRVRIDDIREGFVTVDPAGMRVPLEEAHVTSTVTTGWLFGRQVDVLPGRETRYVIAGYADESTGSPRGGAQLADDGSYRLATDDLSDLVALRAVVDTVISPPSGALAGAHFARAESGVDAPLRLASLAPVLVPASPTRPGLQPGDGAVVPALLRSEATRCDGHLPERVRRERRFAALEAGRWTIL